MIARVGSTTPHGDDRSASRSTSGSAERWIPGSVVRVWLLPDLGPLIGIAPASRIETQRPQTRGRPALDLQPGGEKHLSQGRTVTEPAVWEQRSSSRFLDGCTRSLAANVRWHSSEQLSPEMWKLAYVLKTPSAPSALS